MNKPDTQYWIWGLLDPRNEDLVSEIRKQIEKSIKTPSFPTHLTLSGPLELKLDLISAYLGSFLKNEANIEPIPLKYYGVDWIDSKYQYLYLQADHPKLILFKESIDEIFIKNSNNFIPHISLAYSDDFNFERSKFNDLINNYDLTDMRLEKICIAEVNEKKKSGELLEHLIFYNAFMYEHS